LEFFAYPRLFQARKIIDEYFAFEMIDFMLDARGEQTFGLPFERFAVTIERSHTDTPGACHRLEYSGHGQTAFFKLLFAFPESNFRIDENLELIATLGDIDNNNPPWLVDLDGGETDTRRLIHGFSHVIDQHANGIGDFRYGIGPAPQAWVGIVQDGANRHGFFSPVASANGIRRLVYFLSNRIIISLDATE
jgi:hypothetical protein